MMTTSRPAGPIASTPEQWLCAACSAPMSSIAVCDACGRLDPRCADADPFDLLGFDRVFELDEKRLSATFRALTRKVHPDRFATEPDETRDLASRLCAELNHAYRVLVDPVRRADLLLVQSGGPTATELREVPGNLLAETMTLREKIETAKESKDSTTIERLGVEVRARRTGALSRIAATAARLPALDDGEKTGLRKQLNAMRYYDNLLVELAGDPLGRM